MTVSLKHKFTSAVADGGDTNLVQPSNWNDEHDLVMATDRLLGRTTAGTGAAEEISVGSGLTLSAGTLSASGGGGGVTEVKELVFESSGTYTPNANANFYEVVCIGGGQNGSNANSGSNNQQSRGNAGNGAGGAIVGFTPAQMGGSAITVTIGAAGGTSSFGNYITTTGGSGNAGGTATVNTGTANVSESGNTDNTTNRQSGYSIKPYSGPTSGPLFSLTAGDSFDGFSAHLPGSGGTGGQARGTGNTSASADGGLGGPGLVIVKEYL